MPFCDVACDAGKMEGAMLIGTLLSCAGKVYDVTKFLDEHPGGFDIILSNTGGSLDTMSVVLR